MMKTCDDENCMNGYKIVPNYQHDVMERVECMECLVNDKYRFDLASNLRKTLRECSREQLVAVVSDAFADLAFMNQDLCADVEDMIQAKRTQDLMALISVWLSRPYDRRTA